MKPMLSTAGIFHARFFSVALTVVALAVSLAAPIIGVASAAAGTLALMLAALVLVGTSYGVFSPVCIIASCSVLYALAPAMGILLDAPSPLIAADVYFARALPLCLLYILTLLAVYGFQHRKGVLQLAMTARLPGNKRMLFVALASLFGSLLYLYSIYRDVGLSVGNFNRGEQQIALTTKSSVLLMLAAAGSLYGFGVWNLARQGGRQYALPVKVILFGGLAIFAYTSVFILGDRRVFLSTVFGVLAISRLSRRTTTIMLVSVIPAYVLFALYGGFRGSPLYEWAGIWKFMDVKVLLDPSQGEFGSWARVARDVLSRPYSDIADFTFLKAPFSVIPSFLYPDRPLAPSLWYVRTFDPLTASRGGAWAFSLVIESFMNFWVFGPIVLGFFISMIIAKFERSMMRRLLMVFVLAFSFRFDMVSMTQQTGWTLMFVGMFHVISRGIRLR